MLLESKLLTEDQLTQILAQFKSTGLKLGQYIVRQGILNEYQIIDMLSQQLKIDKYQPDKYPLEMNLAQLIPVEMAEKFRVVPLKKKGRLLALAVTDPLDIIALDLTERTTNCEVDPIICTEREIGQLISSLYKELSSEKQLDTNVITDKRDDIQTITLDDGCTYYGPLINGKPAGYGTLKFPKGNKIDRYEGRFNNGVFNGSGTVTFVDGMIVSCEWKNGNPIEDLITMIFPSGDKYIGAADSLMPKGYGTYYHHDGYKITAYWEEFRPIGKVTWVMQDNSKYEGKLKNMLWHGKGVYTASDGSKYIGDFVNGEFHGHGTMTDCKGEILYSGRWKHNNICGSCA